MFARVVDHNREMSDRRLWAVSGDNDDDNSLVTSGSLSSDLCEEWKNWCVDDPDWVSDVSAGEGRTSENALLQMKHVLEGPLGRA